MPVVPVTGASEYIPARHLDNGMLVYHALHPDYGIAWDNVTDDGPALQDLMDHVGALGGGRIVLPDGVPFATPGEPGIKNIIFTSQWDNYPREATIPLSGHARQIYLLMAGSTNHMQSRLDNGEVIITYRDGHTARLALENPTTWWPIDQDYFIDDFQFQRPGPLPTRIDLKTGEVRLLDEKTFKGHGHKIPGGSATVLSLTLDPQRELESVTVLSLANEVVIGLMAATLAR